MKSKAFFRIYPLSVLVLLGALLFLVACANKATLTGGPKDEQAPKLDTALSTRNFQSNFRKQEIALYFDEWVQLKDVFNQVIVSPPLEKRPIVELRKKSIRFRFDEDEKLRDSATYVINFGNAIVDLNESNPAQLVFVFSTGPFIDSLSVNGKVVDALSGKPVEKALFMLYENTADSVVKKDRPFYFSRTDKDGNFTITNVRAGEFKAVALVDENLNYKYDGQNEKIGFLDTLLNVSPPAAPEVVDTVTMDSISLTPDSLKSTIHKAAGPLVLVRLFQEEGKLLLKEKVTSNYGQVKLIFNHTPDILKITHEDVGQTQLEEAREDTVVVWYDTPIDTSWSLYVDYGGEKTDTISVAKRSRDVFVAAAKVELEKPKTQGPERIHPDTTLTLTFNQPLTDIQLTAFLLTNDSTGKTENALINKNPLNPRQLIIAADWLEGSDYSLKMLPDAVTGFYGITNLDTLEKKFETLQRKDFGELTLRVKNLVMQYGYVIRILNNQGSLIFSEQVSGQNEVVIKRGSLKPGVYDVEIIEDTDHNGKWTTGNYDLHRQPERLFRESLEQLRANWELDVSVEPVFE